MRPYTRDMHQAATYWPPGKNDGFGNIDFSDVTPIVIRCRWQDTAVLFRNAQGQEETSSAVVYPDRELMIRGMLALGDESATAGAADPGQAGAREIRQVGASPSLAGDEVLHKVFL